LRIAPLRIAWWTARVAAGALLTLVATASAWLPPTWGIAGAFNYPVVGGFLAGLAFGWPGAIGGVLGQILGAEMLDRTVDLLGFGSRVLPGLLAFEIFRRVGGVGRGLPNLRSYLTLMGTAAQGSVFYAVMRAASGGLPGTFGDAVWLLFTVTTVSILLLSPLVMIPLVHFVPKLLAPIPNERAAETFQRWRLVGRGEDGAVELVPLPVRRVLWLLPFGLFVLITLLLRYRDFEVVGVQDWISMLYAWPILWVGSLFGLRAALVASALAALLVLCFHPFDYARASAVHAQWVSQFPMLIFFSVGGALWGGMREREGRLHRRIAAGNAQLRRDLERTVIALRSAIEAKDAYTEGHLGRVAEFAIMVGQELGLDSKELSRLEVASALHDVGKIGIPEQVLRKAGPLEPEEQEMMRRHPEIGARILEQTEGLRDAAPLVLHHQERWDGRCDGLYPGYPAGLRGEEIPIGARIIAVVDAFDAMTSDRPYRRSLGRLRAVEVLRMERGAQFDPTVVDTFLAILDLREWERAASWRVSLDATRDPRTPTRGRRDA
jgi:hypothetical protein